jgi:hypothetical protein
MSDIGPLLLSSVAGGSIALASAWLTSALSRRAAIDDDLRSRREQPYARLWASTRLIAQSPRTPIAWQEIASFNSQLRDWYYDDGGGMYLSQAAVDAYVALRTLLSEAAVAHHDRLCDQLDDATYDQVQSACSALRAELTRDLLSRRGPPDTRKARVSDR